MSLEGYALSINPTTDVICAYASGAVTLPAYTEERWIQIGSFVVPETVRARLVVRGNATDGTQVRVALFAPAKVTDSQAVLAYLDEREARSKELTLRPGVTYQIAAAAVAAVVGDQSFGVVRVVSLGNP
jgi:hypothetical protein